MTDLRALLAAGGPAIHVEIAAVRGSSPREPGAFMLVTADSFAGSIGGGQLEYAALDRARRMLRDSLPAETMEVPLGPEIGQCCGGRVTLGLAPLTAERAEGLLARLAAEHAARPQVLIFGAGHVGRALTAALNLLPVRAILIDQRAEELALAPAGTEARLAALPEAEVRAAPPGSAFVVLTHDHALDFLVTDAALARGDAAYVGLIGSASKRARFRAWRNREGTDRRTALAGLTCPIGGPSFDKRPEVIAAMTAAEIVAALTGPTTLASPTPATSRSTEMPPR
jgi:xanthine dehydrogenase accessory factor